MPKKTIKIELEFVENEKFLPFHTKRFSLSDDEKDYLEFCTSEPSGIPLIKVLKGKFAGKSFIVNHQSFGEQFLKFLE